jgi:aldehyde dehydrogenase (NAD+)
MDFTELVDKQRAYFRTGATRSLEFRIAMLKKLQAAIRDNAELIETALLKDMNKCPSETYMTETGILLDEIRFHIRHLAGWMKEKAVRTPLAQFPARSFISPEPYGVALIMSPWNYPVQLSMDPLIGAISAGCTAVVKPSVYAPAASAAVSQILRGAFPVEYVAVVEGGRAENAALLEQEFDYIFFTGSPAVGRLVMESAAKRLTPVTLELGGKSPVIVDETANIPVAARRIAFGKVLNGGQTCIEPDYLFIHESVKDAFVEAYRSALHEFFPNGDLSDMNVIINEKHFSRLVGLIQSGKAVVGGGTDASRRFIEPTLLDEVDLISPIMQEEIFGPILPMLPYSDIRECIGYITAHPRPLSLYLFTANPAAERLVLNSCSFGGGCINDTIIHVASSLMPFGGVGASGMGGYHGKKSFDTFTHCRSMLKKATWLDLPIRYRPYSPGRDKLVRRFLK